MRKLRPGEAKWLVQGHSYLYGGGRAVSPGLERADLENTEAICFLLHWVSSQAPAAHTQTLVPGHLQKLGHPACPGIQRKEGSRGGSPEGQRLREHGGPDRGEGQSPGNFCSATSLQGEKNPTGLPR